ncbi:LON peptidase substrate-binding domain-containing protein [Geitlerinema splendidum]|nr:LON peptidase substrate-binding domain-containing protein [Geitlerinema splendidum]
MLKKNWSRFTVVDDGMTSTLQELPLFPLNTVLFPYARLQIHVFEDRYRDLIRDCLQNDKKFGIALIKNGVEVGDSAEPYLIGTTCRILTVQTYDDGRMDVLVQGEGRFRIRKVESESPYLVGKVENVAESSIEDSPRCDAIILKTKEYLETFIENYINRAEINVAKIKLPDDPAALSFVVANFLQIENIQKQYLLETTDTLERLTEMLPILEDHVAQWASPSYSQLSVNDLMEWVSNN